MSISWTKQQREIAKAKGTALVAFAVDGRLLAEKKFGRVDITMPNVDRRTAAVLLQLFAKMLGDKTRGTKIEKLFKDAVAEVTKGEQP